MNKFDVIFMGTPEFAMPILEEINKYHNVKLVICQPDKTNRRGKKVEFSPVKKFAIEKGIEIFQPENINSEESISYLKNFECDFIVVVAYGQILKEEVRNLPKMNIVNVHASLLPKYRGAAPINRVIMNREKETGISIMKVEKGLDTGEVYLTKKTEVKTKTCPELYAELSKLGADAIIEYLSKYEEFEKNKTIQDDSESTYAEKISKSDGELKFSDIDSDLGKILGLTPKPGAYFEYKNDRIKVHDAEIISEESNEDVGKILKVSKEGIDVAYKNGVLRFTHIQFPGKRIMSVKDFLAGNNFEEGIILR